MMDFDNILDIASQNQGLSSVQRRYSLETGPPKKDPKSKGVNPAAVQALLKKRTNETKLKEMEMKKQKQDLLAKRVELKSDRKARAMASRTKDNFKGYNGIPVVDVPKKRGSKADKQDDGHMQGFQNNSIDPLDDEDNYEYEQTDSEEEPEPLRPGGTAGVHGSSGKFQKPRVPPRPSAPPAMNFADLLKLAEKKQFEPVELKPKAVKKEERLHTASEIREMEMERKAKRPEKHKEVKPERGRDVRPQSSSSLMRKAPADKEQKFMKPQKSSGEKHIKAARKELPSSSTARSYSSSSVHEREGDRVKVSHNNEQRPKPAGVSSKVPSKSASAQVSKLPSSQKSSTSSDLSFRKDPSLLQKGGSRTFSTAGMGQKSQHGSLAQFRSPQSGPAKPGPAGRPLKPAKGELSNPGIPPGVKSNSNSMTRLPAGGPPRPGGQPPGRPVGTPQARPGSIPQVRPGGGHPGVDGSRPSRPGGQVPGRPAGGPGPAKPKCTVVSETISSKNVGGPRVGGGAQPGIPNRPGMGQRPRMGQRPGVGQGPGVGQRPGVGPRPGEGPRPGVGQRPGMGPRPGVGPRPGMGPGPGVGPRPGMGPKPGMVPRPGMPPRPPGPMLPPITSAYKRKYEDEEEYDSEMDDFIDDGGEEQDEISRHIKEIFGYDRNRYKDESDYALKFMESSWKDMQKEEARSLRLAVQEDLEEEKREEEEMKRKAKRKKTS